MALDSLPNDQDSAQRIFLDAWTERLVGPGDVLSSLVLCKACDVVGHPDAVVHAPRDLGQVRLELRLAEIALAGLLYEIGIVFEAPVQLAQLLDAELERLGLVREEAGAHLGARRRDVVEGRVFKRDHLCHCVARGRGRMQGVQPEARTARL